MTVWTRERPPVRVLSAKNENRLLSANLGLDPAAQHGWTSGQLDQVVAVL
jgi:hypothetical protein